MDAFKYAGQRAAISFTGLMNTFDLEGSLFGDVLEQYLDADAYLAPRIGVDFAEPVSVKRATPATVGGNLRFDLRRSALDEVPAAPGRYAATWGPYAPAAWNLDALTADEYTWLGTLVRTLKVYGG